MRLFEVLYCNIKPYGEQNKHSLIFTSEEKAKLYYDSKNYRVSWDYGKQKLILQYFESDIEQQNKTVIEEKELISRYYKK